MRAGWTRHVPNFLSSVRIALAFVFPFVPITWRILIVVVALLTEFFDGHLARKWNAVSRLGQMLDPIADKLFVLSTALTLIFEHGLAPHHFVLVAMRDLAVAASAFCAWTLNHKTALARMLPRPLGKLTTTFQFFLILSLFAQVPNVQPLLWITAFVSCVSAMDYVWVAVKELHKLEATS